LGAAPNGPGFTTSYMVMVPRGAIVVEAGRALRQARQARGMTLRDVGLRSEGRFKPTAVAGYERGERKISLERFSELAELYEMAPDRLLAQIMWRQAGRPEPIIDLGRVNGLPPEEREALEGFIPRVRGMRSGEGEGTISLRIRDLEVLATVSGHGMEEFLEHLRPALVEVPGGSAASV
jgi:transcriptional regulator with XRE-family HTH domain